MSKLCFAILPIFLLTCGCAKGGSAAGTEQSPIGIALINLAGSEEEEIVLDEGESFDLNPIVIDANGNSMAVILAFLSSDTQVITIDATGVAQALVAGQASVSASVGVVTSSPVRFRVVNALTPKNLQATAIGSGVIRVSWDAINPALPVAPDTGIAIVRRGGVTTNRVVVGSVPIEQNIFLDDLALDAATQYFYEVYPYTSTAAFLPTQEVSATTPSLDGAPAAPGNVQAISKAWNVALSWSDLADNEDRFEIERSSDGLNYEKVGLARPNQTDYVDRDVSEQTNYFYRVSSVNAAGKSLGASIGPVATTASTATVLPGPIVANTVLGAGEYFAPNGLTVIAGVKLTILGGVELRFAPQKKLEVRGELDVQGSLTDPVRMYVSQPDQVSTSHTANHWIGIDFKTDQSGKGSLRFAEIAHAMQAALTNCCGNSSSMRYLDCVFRSNWSALRGYTGSYFPITRCRFVGNRWGFVDGAQSSFRYCWFEENMDGLGDSHDITRLEDCSAHFSVFKNNSATGIYAFEVSLEGCFFFGNQTGANYYCDSPFTFQKNTILSNELGVVFFGQKVFSLSNNNVFGNTIFDLKNASFHDLNASDIYWGTTDSAAIASQVWDLFDDLGLGVVNFAEPLMAPIDSTPF